MSVEWRWAGARWWKFDFHTHTPESDYGKGPDQETLKQRTPKEWLLDYMRAGVDCVVVPDYNTGAWIDKLKDALEELYALSVPYLNAIIGGRTPITRLMPKNSRTSGSAD